MIARIFSSRALCLLAFLACSMTGRAAGPHPSLPPPVIPECLGVNIHFTDPKPGELEMLAAAGFKWVRMDLGWGGTERKKGEYDFSAYDRLVAALDQHKLRAVFILDYGNSLYAEPGDKQPFTSRAGTEEFREAYARWAAAAVTHFRNRGYLWELWNEPNHEGFWKPKPDAAQYAAVALAAAKAIRAAAPEEAIVGPATSTIDLPFLETCFQAGLLNYLDAVSVHPYRQQAPDTVVEEYRSLRLLMAKYQRKDRIIPIVSGEWGYSTAWKDFDDAKQGRYLPRQFLTNIANDVALSIWYDWHDDGTNPKEAEHRFGIVGHEYHPGRDPVYDPKPAYQAMKTLVAQLSGYRFNKQLTFGFEQSLLLFAKDEDVKIAWWGKSRGPLGDWLPASPGKFAFTDALGQTMPPMVVAAKVAPKLEITIGENVLYLKTEAPNDLLRVAAAWDRVPLELSVDPNAPRSLRDSFRNPLSRTLEIDVDNTGARKVAAGEKAEWDRPLAPSRQERVSWSRSLNVVGLGSLGQTTRLISKAPLKLVLFPSTSAALHLCVENPSGEAFVGKLRLSPFNPNDFKSIDALRMEVEIKIAAGKKEEIVSIPLQQPAKDYLGMDVVLDEGENRSVLSAMQVFRRIPLDTGDSAHVIAYAMSADGDAKVSSRQTLVEASPKESPAYIDDVSCYRVGYAFDPGWKFIFLTRSEIGWPNIPGQPKQLGFWLHGDGKGLTPRARFVDATGQVFQPDGPKLVWKGWRFVTFPMKPEAGKSLAHWGGAKDGVIHYPIRWDTPLLLDNTDRQAMEGEVYFSAPVLVY